MTSIFKQATRKQEKARVAIDGPAGSGKTYTSLLAATVLANGGKIAVIDTERGSASLYADEFQFDTLELQNFNPQNYINAIDAAEEAGYSVIVIDSLSHAWEGAGGILDMHDAATKRQKTENSYTAWKDVTPVHREFIDRILQSKAHVIVTMRSKMEYSQEKDGNGKTVIRKIGLAPVQRAGTEYEFTVVCDMDTNHSLSVSKSRCKPIADMVVTPPDAKFFQIFNDWLNSGEEVKELTLEEAKAFTMSSGKLYGELTIDELHGVTKSQAPEEKKRAARIIIAQLIKEGK